MTNDWRTAPRDPWFRSGRMEVGTTMAVVFMVVASWLANVVTLASGRGSLAQWLAFNPWLVAQGDVWRIVSWPLANGLDIWAVLNLFFFYVFGSDIERQVGRDNAAKLLAGIWLSLTLASAFVGFALHGSSWLAGIGSIQFLLFLVWIADNPHRMFLFNIPAWVVGLVLVAVQVLQMVAARDLLGVLELLIGFVLVAMIARHCGLLSDYGWIPGRRKPRQPKPKVNRAAQRQERQRAGDSARLDELLDKISAGGMDSLSPAERRELIKLRNRR